MKPIVFFILFLLIPKLAISQISENDKLIYLDSIHLETKSKDYKFYRIIKDYKLDKEYYTILDYYKSGALQMEKTSKNKEGYTTEGDLIYYYENGNKKSIAKFIHNVQTGDDFEWYENGTKKQYRTYIKNDNGKSIYKINQFWDADGVQKVIDGNGEYEYSDDNYSENGKIKNGFYDGVWKGNNKKLNYSYTEIYENGKFVSGVSIDNKNASHSYTTDIKPEPKKGFANFYSFIGQNYKTPNVQGLKGKVYIRFVVDKDGKIIEPKIIRDLGYGTGEEAIRVITNYGNWIPGQQRGINVRVLYTIPITIQSPY